MMVPALLPVTAAHAESRPVQGGRLDWGIKSSFQSYVTGPVAKGGYSLTGGAARAPGDANPVALAFAPGGAVTAGGWTVPVPQGLTSGYGPRDGAFHYGIDLGAPKGTPIRAAAAGVVLTAECDARVGSTPFGCDSDGGFWVSGCGWYVEVEHADNVATRYCHMGQRPQVRVGQLVKAGDVLGLSGSSGNSSGPGTRSE